MASSGRSSEYSQLLKGALEIAVLGALSARDGYGYQLMSELVDAGLTDVGEASVYGTLRRLETGGAVGSRLVASPAGPARRYYTITAAGRRRLGAGAGAWHQLVAAMENLIPGGHPR